MDRVCKDSSVMKVKHLFFVSHFIFKTFYSENIEFVIRKPEAIFQNKEEIRLSPGPIERIRRLHFF